jgi:hypothetical protein
MVPGLSIFENTLLVLGSFEKVLNKKIRSSTTSLATNINPKKRNTLVPLSEPRLILDNSYEINSFISMKRSFSSTTRTLGKETSDQKVDNLNLSFDSEQEGSSELFSNPINSVRVRSDSEESEYRRSLNPKDLVHKDIENVVLNYARVKKPTEKGPYNPDNESDVEKYSPNSTPTSELKELYANNKEGLNNYFEEKLQQNKDKAKDAKACVSVLKAYDYFKEDPKEHDNIMKLINDKSKNKESALRDRQKDLKDFNPENNPSITTSQPLPESSLTTSQPLPESSKRKPTDSDSEPTGKRQKTEDKPSVIDAVIEIESTSSQIDIYDMSE